MRPFSPGACMPSDCMLIHYISGQRYMSGGGGVICEYHVGMEVGGCLIGSGSWRPRKNINCRPDCWWSMADHADQEDQTTTCSNVKLWFKVMACINRILNIATIRLCTDPSSYGNTIKVPKSININTINI